MADAEDQSTLMDYNVDFRATDDQRCTSPYCEAIGSLIYLMVGSISDLAYAVSTLSKFVENPGQIHLNAVKRVLRYIILSKKVVICYISG